MLQNSKPLKLLSLDGGGVRGLSALLILRQLMERMNPRNPPKPCDYFDLVGGTSTGGLIAVMLGRLEMDVESCIDSYTVLSEAIFKERRRHSLDIVGRSKDAVLMSGRFSAEGLENAIKQITGEQLSDTEAKLDHPDAKCKVFVCATRKENSQPACLRSYPNPKRGLKFDCKIWEACRATSAASSFFDPITIGRFKEQFVDGATGRNNPVYEVVREAKDIWPDANLRIQSLVSIGTGQPALQDFGENMLQVGKTVLRIATDTEDTANKFVRDHQELQEQKRYFRFNVTKGLENIGLEEYKKIGVMVAATRHYLETEGISVRMEHCSNSLLGKNTFNAESRKLTIFDIDRDFDENFEKLREWINPPFFESDYENIKAVRQAGTCHWVLEREEFKSWQQSAEVLWIHGKPGCGKSVIAATIIQSIKRDYSTEPSSKHLGYVFCDSMHEGKRDALAVMKILVWQIVCRKDLGPDHKWKVLAAWRAASDLKANVNPAENSSERFSPRTLQFLFQQLVQCYASCSIILDGMDECEHPESLIQWATNLTTSPTSKQHIKLLIVSRNVQSIERSFNGQHRIMSISPADTAGDIVTYVDNRLPQVLTPSMRATAKDRLLEKADGMFLWVALAMAELTSVSTLRSIGGSRILEAVEALPRGLDSFFLHILERIFKSDGSASDETNKIRKSEISLLLEWVVWSYRPLTIDELQVAIDLNHAITKDPVALIPAGDRNSPPIQFKEYLSSLCAPLVHIHSDNTVTIIHSAFQMFVKTEWSRSRILRQFLRSPETVHSNIASVSLRYLMAEVFRDCVSFAGAGLEGSARQFPFQKYAVQYWWLHVTNSSRCTDDSNTSYQQLVAFLESDQAITWIETYFTLPTSTYDDLINIRSALSGWAKPLTIPEWVTSLFQKGLEARKIQLGPEESSTLTSMIRLALAYRHQGRWQEAEELEAQVVETSKRVLGPEHPGTLTSMSSLASTYRKQGRWKKAEELFVKVLEAKKRVLGQEHPDTLASMAAHALTIWNQGRWKETEELFVRVLEARIRVLGPEHQHTLNSMARLALTYRSQQRQEEAEKLEVQVMETCKRVLGEEHPETLASIADLASTHLNQERWKEAGELLMKVVEMRKRVLGPEHPDTLTSMVNLVSTLWKQERWDEAEALEVPVMETLKRVLSEEHPDTLICMGNRASTLWSRGSWKEAEKLELHVMKTSFRVLGPEHPDTLTNMSSRASTFYAYRRFREAEDVFMEVMETRKKVLGQKHPDTLASMASLAHTYNAGGRKEEAIALMREVVALRTHAIGKDHPDTNDSRVAVADWSGGAPGNRAV